MKEKVDFSFIKKVIKTGIPIGIALLLEFLAFNIITILAGRESSLYAAVHSILITMSSATFVIPMAISTALSVKVAYYFGAKKPLEVKKYSYTALIISILAAYQIFDGIQSITGGILKGFKKTEIVSLTVLASYWFIGAPIAYILVVHYNISLRGYWLALAVSLFMIGFIQALIAKKCYKKLFT